MDLKRNLVLDAAALAVYAVVASPAVTGIGMHEWIGLGLFVLFVVHVAAHGGWIADTVRAAFSRPSAARMANLVLDALIALALAVCAVSGLFVSGAVLPSFGWFAPGYFFWDPLHALSAKALLALLVVHVVAHARHVAAFIKQRKGDEADG